MTEKFVWYFMSDGHASYPGEEIDSLKKKNWFSKVEFSACGFGGSNFPVLEQMVRAFPGGKMTNAPTAAELKQSMLFILRTNSVKGSGATKSDRKANKDLKPLWNPKKLQVGDQFSSISYMKV